MAFPVIKQIAHSALHSGVKAFSTTSSRAAETYTKLCFQGGLRTITLAGPSRNALSLKMMDEITNHITHQQDDPALRVIVLRAEGPIFSAGHNLKELTCSSGKKLHNETFKAASKMMLSILQSPVPVIAQVHGLAAAAGCQLVAGCDIAICSNKATFSTPGAQVGIFCSTPGVALARAVPYKVAADMLFTGEPISASQALQYGLVSRVVPEDKLDEEVNKVAASIISKSRAVIDLGKKFFYSQIQNDVHTAYRLGEKVMVSNVSMYDAQEGISSFFEKKKPQWKHTDD